MPAHRQRQDVDSVLAVHRILSVRFTGSFGHLLASTQGPQQLDEPGLRELNSFLRATYKHPTPKGLNSELQETYGHLTISQPLTHLLRLAPRHSKAPFRWRVLCCGQGLNRKC